MKTFSVCLALVASTAFASDDTPRAQPSLVKTAPVRVGQVYVVGNVVTKANVILPAVNLYPGQTLHYPDLALAQRNVAKLGIFRPGSVTVTAEDDPVNPASEYKNVFVNVEETWTSSVRLVPGVGCGGKPVLDLVWEERNLDPLRFPYSLPDLMGGGAFRGGGLMLRLVLLRIPVVP